MRNLTIISIFFAMFFCFLIILSFNVDADTITVGPGGTYDFENINNAISSANDNDTILVYSNTYNENLVIDKSINLVSVNGASNTIIKSANKNIETIEITANNVNISGFRIENLGSTTYSCLKLDTVSNCFIKDNVIKNSNQGNGVYLVSSNSNTIQDNTIESNYIGIYFSNSDSNDVKNNNIQNNENYGIYLHVTSTDNTIYLNDFSHTQGINARDQGTNNWDYNSQGNYWDDYNDYDNNDDGIGDNPYIIEGNGNQDNFPLGDFLSSGSNPIAYIDSISPNPAAYYETVTFIGHGSDDGFIVVWEWKSDGDIIGTTATLSTSSLTVGTHTISFRVQDNDGSWSQYEYATLVINPNQRPTATILEPNNGDQFEFGYPLEFLGDGVDTDGEIVGYKWRSVPVGISSEENTFTNSNLPSGTYTIYLKVRDDYGDWSEETSITIEIVTELDNKKPISDASGPYSSLINKDITFDGSGSFDPDEDDTIVYSWDFGDGSTGEGVFPTHIYKSEGNYTITLTITDSHGEKSVSETYALIASETGTELLNLDQNIVILVIVFIALISVILVVWKIYR
jgi:parallel beta-helix repeat protein